MGDQERPMSATTGAIKKKKEDKHRKRDPRSMENIKKSIANMDNEEKIEFIMDKYSEVYNDCRDKTVGLQLLQKEYESLQKAKERDQNELTRVTIAKTKLESICREMQKQNKAIKDENIARIREEEEKRKVVASSFTERLNQLSSIMTESKDESNKVKEQNQSMTDRLTELHEQFQARQSHLDSVAKQLELEKKLAETKVKKNQIEFEAEKQKLLRDNEILQKSLIQSENNGKILEEHNTTLKTHLDVYKAQYADFEDTMGKSSRIFDNFKEEMAKMGKRVLSLEAERDDWRNRWQLIANNLINLSEQHNKLIVVYQTTEKNVTTLQKLCRQLQSDRATYIQQLKNSGIEPVAVAQLEPENDTEGSSAASGVTKVNVQPKVAKSEEPLLVLRKDLKKIQAEVRELSESPAADTIKEKLTAKEELLKVLKNELAELQRESIKETDRPAVDGSGEASNSKTKKKSKKKNDKKPKAIIDKAATAALTGLLDEGIESDLLDDDIEFNLSEADIANKGLEMDIAVDLPEADMASQLPQEALATNIPEEAFASDIPELISANLPENDIAANLPEADIATKLLSNMSELSSEDAKCLPSCVLADSNLAEVLVKGANLAEENTASKISEEVITSEHSNSAEILAENYTAITPMEDGRIYIVTNDRSDEAPSDVTNELSKDRLEPPKGD